MRPPEGPPHRHLPLRTREGTRAVHVDETCTRCGGEVLGWLWVDSYEAVIDSDGFMLFADGIICDGCHGRDALGKPLTEQN